MLCESAGAGASHSSGPELGFHGFRYVSQWTPYPIKCLWKDCKRELPCRRLLERHVTRHCREASKIQGKRVCSWRTGCLTLPNTFRESSDLIVHVNARHVSLLPWPCPSKDCSKVLNDETALLGHFELMHSTVSRGALRESLNPSSLVFAEPNPLPNHYPTYRLAIPEPLPATFKRANVVRPSIKGIDWDELELDNDGTIITKATPMLIRRAIANPKPAPPAILNQVSEPPPVSPALSAPRKTGLSEDLGTNNYDWSGARIILSSSSSLVNPTSQLSWPAPRRRTLLPPPHHYPRLHTCRPVHNTS
ncbi:hypothetical protein BS47DRAFT_323734 [Hydnum rufescens UP504]|uniref:C2H2-type domain-containing protein n=1 Tax=Hydnum rufescens UP504 TaxID=1448309 RepID=A0A9P6B605_9AGAM|nr:hypothetical protein BS47DRAFT_323734 [Hydnum rufescens UP504]